MPRRYKTPRYLLGRQFEYRVKKLLEAEGYLVVRCARSKPFDLIAFFPGLPPLAVECKRSYSALYHSKEKIEEQRRLAERYGMDFLVAYGEEIWRFREEVKKRKEKTGFTR